MTPADLPAHMAARVVITETGCWRWTGGYDGRCGYGRVSIRLPGLPGRRFSSHRVAYLLLVGPIPVGLQLDHLCRNRGCCNPAHLEPVTALENVRRSEAANYWRNKTHCPRQHPYDEKNTGRSTKGGRICRACARDKMRDRRAAARSKQLRTAA